MGYRNGIHRNPWVLSVSRWSAIAGDLALDAGIGHSEASNDMSRAAQDAKLVRLG